MSYTPVVQFPNQTADFAYGFEAGVIWGALLSGAMLENRLVHAENRQLIVELCAQKNQHVTFEDVGKGWLLATTHPIAQDTSKLN